MLAQFVTDDVDELLPVLANAASAGFHPLAGVWPLLGEDDLVSRIRSSLVTCFGCYAVAEALDAGQDVVG